MAGNHHASDPLCHSFNFNAFDGHDHSKHVGEPLRGMNPSIVLLMDGHCSASSQDVSNGTALDDVNVAFSHPLIMSDSVNDSLAVPATTSFNTQFDHGLESSFGVLSTLPEEPGDASKLSSTNLLDEIQLSQSYLSAGPSSPLSMPPAPTPTDEYAVGLYLPPQASIIGPQDSLGVIYQPAFLTQATEQESNQPAERYFGMQPLAAQPILSRPSACLDHVYQHDYSPPPIIPSRISSDAYAPIKLPQLLPMGPGAAVYVGCQRGYMAGHHRNALGTSSILPRIVTNTSSPSNEVLPHFIPTETTPNLSRQDISGSLIDSIQSRTSKSTNAEEHSLPTTHDASSSSMTLQATATPCSIPPPMVIPSFPAPKQAHKTTKRTAASCDASKPTMMSETPQGQAGRKRSARKARSTASKANIGKPAGTRTTKLKAGASKKPSMNLPCDFPGCIRQSCDERSLERHKATHTRTAAGGWYCPGMLFPPGEQDAYRKCTCPPLGYTRNDPLKRHLDKMIRACPSSPCVVEGTRWGYNPEVEGSIKNLWRFKPYLQAPAA